MKLFLMRHAHSQEGDEMDGGRGLTSKGVRQVKLMRQFRKDLGIKFDVVFSSDFQRAVETVAVANKGAQAYRLEQLRPDGTAEDAYAAMYHAYPIGDDSRVLVVSHNPLIQKLAASAWVGFSADMNHFSHGSMLRIDTHTLPPEKHPLHWIIRPGLIEHMYDSDVVESATRIVEHLGRANKAAAVNPEVERLKQALSRRFRTQANRYRRGLGLGLHEKAAKSFRRMLQATTRRAYDAGTQIVGGQLAVLKEAARFTTQRKPPGYTTPEDLDTTIDETSQARIDAITREGSSAGLAAAAIAAAVQKQLRDWAGDRAETIASHEISKAFHAGGRDIARIVNEEGGGSYVQKAWDGESDACEEICMPAIEDGWIDEDILFANGQSEPPGHPNCKCSANYRIVRQTSEESRR